MYDCMLPADLRGFLDYVPGPDERSEAWSFGPGLPLAGAGALQLAEMGTFGCGTCGELTMSPTHSSAGCKGLNILSRVRWQNAGD